MNIRRTILSRKEWPVLKHLGENAPSAPNINRNIVFLPCEHDIGGPIIPFRYVAGHLRTLYSGGTKITNLGCQLGCQLTKSRMIPGPHFEIAILIYKNVAWFLSYENDKRE